MYFSPARLAAQTNAHTHGRTNTQTDGLTNTLIQTEHGIEAGEQKQTAARSFDLRP